MSIVIDMTLGESIVQIGPKIDRMGTNMAPRLTRIDISVSFRDTFGTIRARREFRLTSNHLKLIDFAISYGEGQIGMLLIKRGNDHDQHDPDGVYGGRISGEW